MPVILCYASVYVRTAFTPYANPTYQVNSSEPMLQSVVLTDHTLLELSIRCRQPQ